jgi:hypothetical protein
MTLSNAFISLNDIINNFLISYTGPGRLIPDAKRTEVVFHARRCLQEFAYETLKSQMNITGTTTAYVPGSVGPPVVPAIYPYYPLPSDFVATISLTRSPLIPSATLANVTITSSFGLFSCDAITELTIGGTVTIAGTDIGDGLITGYVYPGPKTYYIIATNGTSQFQLSETLGGAGVVTVAGTTTGLTFSLVNTSVPMTQVTTRPTTSTTEYYIDYINDKIYFGEAISLFNIAYNYLSNALTTDETASIPKLAEEALYACMIYAILANRENTNPNTLQRLLIEKVDKLERSKSRLVFTSFTS